ncbi:hypothetical protein [Paraburkholderia adhaesiva]|uniref:hypothetical protein n=1 Tax=Paraburkholderia adhaesiva TaxID=2883244 RepID=UPI001F1D8955|nr:hypothetical protein [Paraburkholderia adhaesiva]
MAVEVRSAQGQYLQALADGLAKTFPRRIVTREVLDYAKRPLDDIRRGVYTIVSAGRPKADWPMQAVEFLVVGEVLLPEGRTGADVEEVELRMLDELVAYLEGVKGLGITLGAADQSMQIEAPYGWVKLAGTAGPFDATQWLRPDVVDPVGINPFQKFFTDVDIPPFCASVVHDDWLREAGDKPDYSKGQPDLQMQANMPGSTQ